MCMCVVWLLQYKEDKKDKLVLLFMVMECEILKLMVLGKIMKEIVVECFLSVYMVMIYCKNIFCKLEVNNVYEVIKYVFCVGIVDVVEYYIQDKVILLFFIQIFVFLLYSILNCLGVIFCKGMWLWIWNKLFFCVNIFFMKVFVCWILKEIFVEGVFFYKFFVMK